MEASQLSGNVKTAYDEFYKKHDEDWRMLGAKYKAQHIMEVCSGLQLKTVLEVGAGDGSILKYLSDAGFAPEYHAVEISESGVEHIKNVTLAASPRYRCLTVTRYRLMMTALISLFFRTCWSMWSTNACCYAN